MHRAARRLGCSENFHLTLNTSRNVFSQLSIVFNYLEQRLNDIEGLVVALTQDMDELVGLGSVTTPVFALKAIRIVDDPFVILRY